VRTSAFHRPSTARLRVVQILLLLGAASLSGVVSAGTSVKGAWVDGASRKPGVIISGSATWASTQSCACEMRAASIKDGVEKKLAAGDVVTIPAKVPHQLKIEKGKEFTYFVVKVTQP